MMRNNKDQQIYIYIYTYTFPLLHAPGPLARGLLEAVYSNPCFNPEFSMDFKRLQSTIFSNYNRGAFCSGNSTIMQLGAEKKQRSVRCGELSSRTEGREGTDGQNKAKKSHKQKKKHKK